MSNLSGVIPAIPTPLQVNEDVDVEALRKVVDYVIKEGASGVMIGGGMGEGAAILDSQRILAVEVAVLKCMRIIRKYIVN